MGTQWIDGAERLGDGSIGGAMDYPHAPARVVWHTTESGTGDAAFEAVAGYLTRIGAEPQILYDPSTDRIGQYGPLGESARALKNYGNVRTNRVGRVCIQIEVLGQAARPFTKTWKPGPNFRKLMAAIRSWDIPDVFPAGAPPKYPGTSKRSNSIWMSKGGHYCHANIPGNDHGDPGAISTSALFKAAGAKKAPSVQSSTRVLVVKASQTLGVIAASVGVTLATVLSMNPAIHDPDVIHPGDRITVPAKPAPSVPKNPPTALKPKPAKKLAPKVPAYPGATNFRAGAYNNFVTILGRALVRHGYGRYYQVGPGPRWTDADRAAVHAFQRAQGWSGAGADGYPGPETWRRLMK